jgi:hypothetical protein
MNLNLAVRQQGRIKTDTRFGVNSLIGQVQSIISFNASQLTPVTPWVPLQAAAWPLLLVGWRDREGLPGL